MAQQQPVGVSSAPPPAKKGLSSKLMQLKFMQRAVERKTPASTKVEPKEVTEEGRPASTSGSPSAPPGIKRGLVIIHERDPLPGTSGRQSFGDFNRATQKLHNEQLQAEATAASSSAAAGASPAPGGTAAPAAGGRASTSTSGAAISDQDLANAFKRPKVNKTLSMAPKQSTQPAEGQFQSLREMGRQQQQAGRSGTQAAAQAQGVKQEGAAEQAPGPVTGAGRGPQQHKRKGDAQQFGQQKAGRSS